MMNKLATYYSLLHWAEFLGPDVTVKALRAEVQAKRLACIRTRPGCNAKILVCENAIQEWIAKFASKRTIVPAPRDA